MKKPFFGFPACRRKWRLVAAGLATAAAVAGTATFATAELRTSPHPAHATIGLADSSVSITGQSSTDCSPVSGLPVLTAGGTVSTLPNTGDCSGTTSGGTLQGTLGQSQNCQLTEEQQQDLITRAKAQQAANDERFQSELLKNLLALAAAKSGGAAFSLHMSGYTKLSPQDVTDLIQNGTVTPADMAAAILQTLQELGEDTAGVTVSGSCTGDENQNPNYSASSSDSNSSGDSADNEGQSGQDQAAPSDLGSDWVPQDPKNICESTGCEDVAVEIQQKIGGTRYRIEDSMGAPTLGKYRGEDTYWNYHEVVIKDGRVYDAWTGRTGELLDTYRGNWQYGQWLKFTPIG
ncbi:hypothetical protein GCM10011578_066720 [Streptomyces fuscichromogenes]|uniref:Uncharacterized protein n=1 Tax=Streptomyces fuscichromogenes TaxID=1324013 RepID=A0A918CUJ7_9ACTN|nr:hypothetical protein GCM10011578_066720 [Streptomyces fuscichromogenes]